jgi:hypothetical protein
MKKYVCIFFFLGILLSFGTSVIANGYLTSWTDEHDSNEIRLDLAHRDKVCESILPDCVLANTRLTGPPHADYHE